MQMLVRGRFDRYIFRPNFLQPTVETWLELCKHLSQEVSLCDTGSGCTNAFNISWKRHAVLGSPGTRLQQSPVGRASDRLVRSQLQRSKRTRLVTQCGHNPEGGSQSSTVDERNLPYDHGAMLRPKPSVVPAGRTRGDAPGSKTRRVEPNSGIARGRPAGHHARRSRRAVEIRSSRSGSRRLM